MNNNIGCLQGTPWHIGYIGLQEGDTRRHKKWCKYYHNNRCSVLSTKCIGSSFCENYKELISEDKKNKISEVLDDNDELLSVKVNGYISGEYHLYVYQGGLRGYTNNKTQSHFIKIKKK